MADLTSLIERIEAATEGSRELDLAVHLALFPNGEIAGWMKYPRGLSGREGYSWDISGSALIFEKWTADGRCPYNGGVTLPHVSTSIDDALTLMPKGWWLTLDRYCISDKSVDPFAWRVWLKRTVGDDDGDGPCGMQKVFAVGPTPPLALLAAILRARQTEPTHDES